MKDILLGFSPCPNDTFMFYALLHGRVPAAGIRFRPVVEDVETLNQMALGGKLDVTKVSFHALAYLRESYGLIRSGSALGRGCGPLLVARESLQAADLRNRTIAIPGRLTTAFLLLRMFDPALGERIAVMPFHEIVSAVACGSVDAGLIIHESRFTYHEAGLTRLVDLGEWWEGVTGLPIPLGGIVARRDLDPAGTRTVEAALRESIAYAFANPAEPRGYVKRYAQELDDRIIERHIALYVNDFSLDLGDEGIRAVETLFAVAEERGIIPASARPIMLA